MNLQKGDPAMVGASASQMIKLAKDEEEEEEITRNWNCLPSPRRGSS